MTMEIGRRWSAPDDYDQAVEAAGVTELPDSPHGLPDEVAAGRFEDDDPPGAPQ